MMPAAKHGDPQMGVDIHLCVVPPSPSPVPLPTPHMSVVFDPFDYLPILGATVTVCGMKRAVAGTAGKAVHIPPGFPFAPKMPDTDDESLHGERDGRRRRRSVLVPRGARAGLPGRRNAEPAASQAA